MSQKYSENKIKMKNKADTSYSTLKLANNKHLSFTEEISLQAMVIKS